MPLKEPRKAKYGRLDGAVLLGMTEKGDVGPGHWLWLEFKKGKKIDVQRLKEPSGVRGRFELMLPGDPEPARLMDVRAVARMGTAVPAGQALEVIKAKHIVFAGDEAFFIRFTPELLELVGDVFAA